MFLANHDSHDFPTTPYLPEGGPHINTEEFAGEHHADIVVIGGGIAGCSLALHAAAAARVVVLEAKEVGWGASSRNAGHLAPATKIEPGDMLRRFGREAGERMIAASRAGPGLVYELASKHGIDIAAQRSGVITAAHNRKALDRLQQRAEVLQELGYSVRLLDRAGTATAIGNDPQYYHGSVLDDDGGTMNPLAYVRGLARAAMAQGASIYQNTPAVRIRACAGSGTKRWLVETATGSVLADYVVLCTNGYTDDLWPGLKRSIVPVRAYQFMTSPLESRWRPHILPHGLGMTDTRRLMSGVRQHTDGRLHFSGIGPLFGPEEIPYLTTSARRISHMFPQLGKIKIDYWWSGWLGMNRENTWKVHELAPGVMAALGCNGRGVAIATTLGRDLARQALGQGHGDMMIPFTPLTPIPVYAAHRPLVRALVSYYRLRDAIDDVLG